MAGWPVVPNCFEGLSWFCNSRRRALKQCSVGGQRACKVAGGKPNGRAQCVTDPLRNERSALEWLRSHADSSRIFSENRELAQAGHRSEVLPGGKMGESSAPPQEQRRDCSKVSTRVTWRSCLAGQRRGNQRLKKLKESCSVSSKSVVVPSISRNLSMSSAVGKPSQAVICKRSKAHRRAHRRVWPRDILPALSYRLLTCAAVTRHSHSCLYGQSPSASLPSVSF